MTPESAASPLLPTHSRSWQADASAQAQAELRKYLAQAFATPFPCGDGLNLMRGADALVQEGALTRARADQLLARLEELNAAGHHCATGVFHVVAGHVPPLAGA